MREICETQNNNPGNLKNKTQLDSKIGDREIFVYFFGFFTFLLRSIKIRFAEFKQSFSFILKPLPCRKIIFFSSFERFHICNKTLKSHVSIEVS
jgi:hypothetical protein